MILFIKHVEIEGPDTLGVYFLEMGYNLGICNLYAGDQLPGDVSSLDAVVSLGGPMNVYEERKYPFLANEDVFIKKILERNVPFLGICLGAQLLSKASGGKVTRSLGEEIGWFNISLTDEGMKERLFKGCQKHMEVYQWHGDMCVLPASGVLLATSERCPVQAFRYGPSAYGLQFHIEVSDKSINEWCFENKPGKDEDRQAMLAHYWDVKKEFHRCGRVLCENFAGVIKSR